MYKSYLIFCGFWRVGGKLGSGDSIYSTEKGFLGLHVILTQVKWRNGRIRRRGNLESLGWSKFHKNKNGIDFYQ